MANPVNYGFNRSIVRRESDSDEEQDAGSSASGHDAHETGRIQSAQPGREPAINTPSTARGGALPDAPGKQPAPTGNAAATASRPAYSAATQAPSAREIALPASALQMRAAMQKKDPLKALKTIFKASDLVRLEVPSLIFRDVRTEVYWKFSERHWLKQLRLHYLDVKFEVRRDEAPLDLSDHMRLFIQLLKSCNELTGKDKSQLCLSMDVLSRSTAAFPSAHEQGLADSAVEARAALMADDPLPALERLA